MSDSQLPISSDNLPARRPKSYWLSIAFVFTLCIAIYSRLFWAGFAGLDDDLHVYANPFLNPPTLASVADLWHKPYEGLYVPLAYTLFAIIAHFAQIPEVFLPSIGQKVAVNAAYFHAVNIVVHALNSALVFAIAYRLIKDIRGALLCALLFALHPLQVESVGWVSELRGLSGSLFGLIALNLFLASRQLPSERKLASILLLFAATLSLIAGMLCKPSIVALPLAVLAIDRIVLQTPGRKALILAAIWMVCTLPFLEITRSIQAIASVGQSAAWQRPFVAGDALAFYIEKLFVPIDLCIDYGHTPHVALAHWWGYLTWLLPAAILLVAYRVRITRPLTWLGALLFVLFLAPELGLVPFSFQQYSTVGDRYAYLSLIGMGLIVADTIARSNPRNALIVVGAILCVFAAITVNQTKYWLDNEAFLKHVIAVNPNTSFAYNNLGQLYFGDNRYPEALNYLLISQRVAPYHVNTDVNIANTYFALGQSAQALDVLKVAIRKPTIKAVDYSDIGVLLLKMNDHRHAIQALAIAVQKDPGSPTLWFNYANGLQQTGDFVHAAQMYSHAIALAPNLPGPHTGLGVILAQSGHLPDAIAQFQLSLELSPGDATATADLAQAQQLLAQQQSGH